MYTLEIVAGAVLAAVAALLFAMLYIACAPVRVCVRRIGERNGWHVTTCDSVIAYHAQRPCTVRPELRAIIHRCHKL